ncbi:DUF6328 family protein [Streptomyces bambusae]|uniref:DUF6328 family protein n=1 Tax=Streptomyces bambusae TaxID=1550616 RepID=UPI001C718B24|nr:DUF6328 family protein [Streptomyces bambusae]
MSERETSKPGTYERETSKPGTYERETSKPGTYERETSHPGTGDPGTGDRGTGDSGTGDPERHESAAERADRHWAELLQELRVTQTGVQILFAFLLTVVFQPRFTELGATDRTIYVVTVVLGAATTGVLVGPVSFHRLVFGRRLKPEAVIWASRLTIVGLVLLFCTMASTMLLILRMVLPDSTALWLVVMMAIWFALCWIAIPLWALRHTLIK